MIKYETTQMAVKDLEKYHVALDKVWKYIRIQLSSLSLLGH